MATFDPTPESYDTLADWYRSHAPDQADRSLIVDLLHALQLGTAHQRFVYVRDQVEAYRETFIPRNGLYVVVDYYPDGQPGRFHIVTVVEDPDATDDPWALP